MSNPIGTCVGRWHRVSLTAVMTLASCVPYGIHTDYDHEVRFEGLRSFAWMDSTRRTNANNDNPFLERRVKRAVEAVMAERGLIPMEPDRADLLVTAFVIGPTRGDMRTPRWGAMCGPSLSIWFGPRYPYGFSRRRSPWFFNQYWPDPWGYACAYQIGFGYAWLPLYEAPGRHLPGTLVIDILDRETRELLWRGSAERALIDTNRSDQRQEDINRVVREILARFPPD